jgi:hypothetical protein
LGTMRCPWYQVPVAREISTGAAKRVTRDVEPAAVRQLLDHPPRATVGPRER